MCKRKDSNLIIYFTLLLLFFFINNQGKQHKMPKKSNVQLCSYQVKKQFHHMNGVHVMTVKSHRVEIEFSVHFLVTGACQNVIAIPL